MDQEFNPILRGDEGALRRALYKSMKHTGEDLKKPIIGIANSYTNANPGHYNLNSICDFVQKGIKEAGGMSMSFGVIASCDGISAGHEGMRYSLPSRDIIAASVEIMARTHRFDGLVLLASCDKIVPGMLMAAARLDIPCILINGGPMYPAVYKGKHWDGNIITEALGWKQLGIIDDEEFKKIENLAEPTCGSCAMMGTANTMCCIAEALGMALPGSASIPAVDDKRTLAALETGRRIIHLVKNGISSRKFISKKGLENALTFLLTLGGSTNAVMHLQAIHRDAGLGELSLKEIGERAKACPQTVSVYPSSEYDMVDFYEAGGVPAVLKNIGSLLHKDALICTGETLGESLDALDYTPDGKIIKPIDNPFDSKAGLGVLYGNLAEEGSIIKTSAVPRGMERFSGPAVVFDSEADAIEGIKAGAVVKGDVIVLRYEGPKGGPGMPEMYLAMKTLEGLELLNYCALITDGRFSGSNRGLFVGHISPEAAEGGLISLVQNGDIISIDSLKGSLELHVSPAELNKRRSNFSIKQKEVPLGILQTYQYVAESAAKGAIWRTKI